MRNKGWQELVSRISIRTTFFKLFKKDFRRPDGTIIKDYYLFEKPHSVHIVAITKDSKIVLVKHYRPGLGDISIELPAGSISRETPESAASRELLEETGYFPGNLLEISDFSQDTSRFVGCACHLFLAWNLLKVEDRKLLEEDREIDVMEVTPSEAMEMIKKRQIKDLPTIAGILLSRLFIITVIVSI
ncbi:MAG: NUDIX hydrolase [Candidatus Nealsonbacteria bacterium]|nr:NUDIX hydrolase [Candidatus Nealsonbacteria bacterium]